MSAVDTGAETSRVLAANAAFYDAFRRKDITRMKALWSDDEPVFCIHPGWAPLAGRESVIGSFAAIMEQPASPEITCEGASVRIDGQHATVICFEVIEGNRLVATNLFLRDSDGQWRLYHHHAGPTRAPGAERFH